jgi:hypothetical protein
MIEGGRRILSITAPGSGSGKTLLASTILRAFPGIFAALKVSTVYQDEGNRSTGASSRACRRLKGDYTVITDLSILDVEGTDTGRLLRAGASRTVWCLVRPGAHAAAWREVRDKILARCEPLLTEGNRIARVVNPFRLVTVVHPGVPRDRWKENVDELMARADLILVNAGPASPGAPDRRGAPERLAGELRQAVAGPVIVQDVARPLGTWEDPTLLRSARSVAGGPARDR